MQARDRCSGIHARREIALTLGGVRGKSGMVK
jgi:hypothetical protein